MVELYGTIRNDTVYVVDAKAHVSELSSGNEINEEVSAKEKLT